MNITINNRSFRFTDKALAQLNAILKTDQVMPVNEKWRDNVVTWEDNPTGARELAVVLTTEWRR